MRLAPAAFVWLIALAPGSALLAGHVDARACAPAPPEGFRVAIAQEQALIVWDDVHKVEHFVRRAAFDTKAPSFGFLVPTPTQPALAEAADDVFRRLEEKTRPVVRHEHVRDVSVGCWSLMLTMRASAPDELAVAAPPPVRVLDEQRVAGMDAVVLEADSAGALADWLKAHGYPLRPALERWVGPYVAAKWKITAFKFDGPKAGETAVGTKAVRLSFPAERPFYPYREPDDAETSRPDPSAPRSLRVFVIASSRMDASLAKTGTPWGAKVDYAATQAAPSALLEGAIPAAALAPQVWLTAFVDDARVRPADDLELAPRPGGAPVIPPEIVIRHSTPVVLPIELLVVVGVVGFFIARSRSKRRAKAPNP